MKARFYSRIIFFVLIAAFPILLLAGACASDVPLIAVEVNPLCQGSVNLGGQVQFNATIFVNEVIQAPDPDNSAVTWSVLGGDVNGKISNDAGSEGLYTAPNNTPPDIEYVTIIATSKEDTQKQGQASVFLETPCPSVPPFVMSF